MGNRRDVTKVSASAGSVSESYAVNVMNEYASIGPLGAPVARTHDANGNLTDDGSRVLVWDAFNRLVGVARKSDGAPIAVYSYLPDGRRSRKVVYSQTNPGVVASEVRSVWDGAQEVEEQSAGGVSLATFVWSPVYVDELVEYRREAAHPLGAGSFYAHQDARCDVVAVTDQGGQVVEKRRYDDFGREEIRDAGGAVVAASPSGLEYGFQGRRRDSETGWLYFRARMYDPEVGRFLSRDPVWDAGNVGGWYSFAGNGPVSGRDPSGLQAPPWILHENEQRAREEAPRIAAAQGRLWFEADQRLIEFHQARQAKLAEAQKAAEAKGLKGAAFSLQLQINRHRDEEWAIRDPGTATGLQSDPTPLLIVTGGAAAGMVRGSAGAGLSVAGEGAFAEATGIPMLPHLTGGRGVVPCPAKALGERGVRNTAPLTPEQIRDLTKAAGQLGIPAKDLLFQTRAGSAYSEVFDKIFLGPNVLPAPVEARTMGSVFERLTPRAVIAHEAGHMITTRAKLDGGAGTLIDEVQASLVGRQLPRMSNVERYQLLRDAAERARAGGTKLRSLLPELPYFNP